MYGNSLATKVVLLFPSFGGVRGGQVKIKFYIMSKKYLQITLFSGLLRAIALAMTFTSPSPSKGGEFSTFSPSLVIASGAKQFRY